MKIAAFPNSSAARFWRIDGPLKYVARSGHEVKIYDGPAFEEAALWADIVILQSIVDKEGIATLRAYQKERGLKIVVDCDDYLEVNPDNPHKIEHDITSASEIIKITLGIADLVTTTTKPLKSYLAQFNNNVELLPNYIDVERWDMPKLRNESSDIRIGWAGSITHIDDLKAVQKPLTRICEEFDYVKLVFVGDTRAEDLFPGCRVEAMLGVPFEAWPTRLGGLRLDIGIAPLKKTPFNECKSNIKWQEYAIAKIPGVYSNTVYWQKGFDGHLGFIADSPEKWYLHLRNLVVSEALRYEISDRAYYHVKSKYDLADHADSWLESYRKLVYK